MAGLRASVDAVEPLAHWEAWVRGTVFDVELLAPLQFAVAGNRGFELSCRDAKDVPRPLVRVLRPVAEDSDGMRQQLQFVLDYADLRSDRQVEIQSQIPQLMTYWAAIAGLRPDRHRWTMELLGATVRFAIAVELRFKHALALARPVELSPKVQPMILTPGHSSFPSGHSTEAHCAARVLMALRGVDDQGDGLGAMLLRQAARIAVNRTIAGVHYPIDSRAGQVLGTCLAEYIVGRCADPALQPVAHMPPFSSHTAREFDAEAYLLKDFQAPVEGSDSNQIDRDGDGLRLGAAHTPVPSRAMAWLWLHASAEWR